MGSKYRNRLQPSNNTFIQVSDCSMSKILLKIVNGAIYLKNDRKQAKEIIEEVEKELDGLGIVKAVHRYVYFSLQCDF